MKKSFLATPLIFISVSLFGVDIATVVQKGSEVLNSASAISTSNKESNPAISNALKEALNIGIQSAMQTLGKENGFLGNPNVKIEFPQNMLLVKTALESMGAKQKVNDFVVAMNHSAEKSIVNSVPIFVKALEDISIADAQKILMSSDNAATNYLKGKTKDALIMAISPIIKDSMTETGLMGYYSALDTLYKTSKDALNINPQIKGALSMLTGNGDTTTAFDYENIEGYVVNKTLDGMFFMVAQKEAEIRNNPALRTTNLLKDIFKLQD